MGAEVYWNVLTNLNLSIFAVPIVSEVSGGVRDTPDKVSGISDTDHAIPSACERHTDC